MRRLIAGTSLFLLVLTTWQSTAEAYVLPTDFLLRMVADRRRRMGVRDMSVQLRTELDNGKTEVDERLYLKQPERLRIQTQSQPESIWVENEGVRGQGPKSLSRVNGPPTDLLAVLFAAKGDDLDQVSAHMVAALRSAGVDVGVVTLARNGEDVVYVIGAHSWEDAKPQVWIDKERFLPVRWILFSHQGAKTIRLETRLIEYGSAVGGDWFPRVIENYRDNVLVRRAEVVSVQINEGLPETLFAVP